MKKLLVLLLSVILLLPSCQRADAATDSLTNAVKRIQSALVKGEDFTTADEDFIADNLGSPAYLEEGTVCFDTGTNAREFGVFRLKDRTKANEFKEAVRTYLQNESEALASLAELYPAEELEARLALYQNATVGNEGMLVFYFVLDKKETAKAMEALTGR